MRRSATHILRGMGTRTDDPGHMYAWKHTHLLLKSNILQKIKNILKMRSGQFSGRAGTLNKYFFIWPYGNGLRYGLHFLNSTFTVSVFELEKGSNTYDDLPQ